MMFGSKKRLIVLFLLVFALKLLLGVYFSHLSGCNFPARQNYLLAVETSDTFSYLDGADNALAENDYYFWNGARKVRAGRMPFYGAPYFALRLFFDKPLAGDVYALWQILLDATANFVFAFLCFEVSRRRAAFWFGGALYFCSFSYFCTTLMLAPESLALSFFVFFIYFQHRYWRGKSFADAIRAASMLAILTVLKPYFVILYAAFFLGVWLSENRWRPARMLSFGRQISILALPLLLLLTPWIARNAVVLHRFIASQEDTRAGYDYSQSQIAVADFAGAWGSDSIYWDSNDAGCYFTLNPPSGCNFRLPDRAIAPGYTVVEVERARADYFQYQLHPTLEQDIRVAREFERLTAIYQRERPLMYHVAAPLLFARRLFWHTGNFNLPINPSYKCFNSAQLIFKIAQGLIYLAALTLGFCGLVGLAFRRKTSILIVIVSPLLLVVFFAFIRTSEYRYVNPVYQILLLGLTCFSVAAPSIIKAVLVWARGKRL